MMYCVLYKNMFGFAESKLFDNEENAFIFAERIVKKYCKKYNISEVNKMLEMLYANGFIDDVIAIMCK